MTLVEVALSAPVVFWALVLPAFYAVLVFTADDEPISIVEPTPLGGERRLENTTTYQEEAS